MISIADFAHHQSSDAEEIWPFRPSLGRGRTLPRWSGLSGFSGRPCSRLPLGFRLPGLREESKYDASDRDPHQVDREACEELLSFRADHSSSCLHRLRHARLCWQPPQ